MPRYHVFHPDHEIIGKNIVDFQNAIGGDEVYPTYAKHGLANPDPEKWYPLQNLLDAFNKLDEDGGGMYDFISLGMKAIDNLVLPPEIQSLSLVQAFQLSDTIYKMNHRGSEIGSLRCEVLGDKHIKMTYVTPFPDHLWYGIAYGFARQFVAKGTHITVYYDEAAPRRDLGGASTSIHVKWE